MADNYSAPISKPVSSRWLPGRPVKMSTAFTFSMAAATAAAATPPPTASSAWPLPKLGWSSADGTLPSGYAPAYLASGLFGVRVPRYALGGSVCKDGDPKQCPGDRTVQCLVGGYEHRQIPGCTVGCDHAGEQLGSCAVPIPDRG